MRRLPWLLLALSVLGCRSVGSVSGAAVGIATGSVTTNPVVGYAAAVGTKAAVDELVRYISRRRQQGEQDEIAEAVGALAPGQSAPWQIVHTIPIGDEHGTVTVLDDIDNKLATCKDVVFTVDEGDKPDSKRARYFTTACARGSEWKWALAEPAVERWGSLQ